jgi:hypothetical protein
MLECFDETERPTEWLRRLEHQVMSYEELVTESGGLALAAYRVARARCRVRSLGMCVPTQRELTAAAREIEARIAVTICRSEGELLARECEEAGLRVITPIPPQVFHVA